MTRAVDWRRNVFALLSALSVFVSVRDLTAEEQDRGAFQVTPRRVSLYALQDQQLQVSSLDEMAADLTRAVRYESTNPEIASVSKTGLLRSSRAGKVVITVRYRGQSQQVLVNVSPTTSSPQVSFTNDVLPILTKRGCNSGGCHGKATGQNGFKLSLLGFDAGFDYGAIVKQARGRRLFLAAPRQSLLLRKATGEVPHGGGQRFTSKSDDYRLITRWIAEGGKPSKTSTPGLVSVNVFPKSRVFHRAKSSDHKQHQQLIVTAHMSDGSIRDVTRQAVFQSNEPEIGTVESSGFITTHGRPGLFAVMVRYGGKINTFHATVPFDSSNKVRQTIDRLGRRVAKSKIDHLVFRQWRDLGLVPSKPASDGEFIRRVSVDICGTLPTIEEVKQFVADKRPDKHARLVDRLLRRPEYASYFALKWADILQNRGRGYSTSKQRPGTALFSGWIRDSIATNKPYDQFVTEIITATGSQITNPPTVWHRSVRTLPNYVESVAQAFLGVRIQCAQCHHHPFDRWSQADYYSLAAVFSRVGRKNGFADAEVPTNETIFLKVTSKPVKHPRSGRVMQPRPLGAPVLSGDLHTDPRLGLARWMTRTNNPFFARTMVNRMWAHFMGRGIISPIDDARSTNPPTNPELLQTLSDEFVASRYDVKQLIRAICTSYAYRLSAIPHPNNAEDTQSFARYYSRRMIAEVLLDGMSQVLEVPTDFSGGPGKFPAGTRAIDLPDENVPAHFLDVFGRPARTSACECERGDSPSLAQALELVNSKEIHRKLTHKDGWAAKLAANKQSHERNTQDIFMRVFARQPTEIEQKTAVEFLKSEKDRVSAYQSLLWSLLATNEFLFNH